jgi:FSR family fosmidomycin resistance protein-like MFS transporter
MLNDMMQSVLLAIYPMLHARFALNFVQIGLLTLTYQLSASLLQPCIGFFTDRRPLPYSLPVGMCFTLAGMLIISRAPSFGFLLIGAGLVGTGSSVFHPESSRVARMAAGGRYGLAQSVFQVGGNSGAAFGPLLAAAIVIPFGQQNVAWFSVAALIGIAVLSYVGYWYSNNSWRLKPKVRKPGEESASVISPKLLAITMGILLTLIFSKYFYMASITTYLTFYLINKFQLSGSSAQMFLFLFLASVAAGTIIGGPVGDRIGRKRVIWGSIFGVAPFALMLPHANLLWTGVLIVIIGMILASAFPAIIVYAQELMPGRVGMVAGLFFGFSFGMGGIGAAVLGYVADLTNINLVYSICAFLPLLGICAAFLPDMKIQEQRV